MENSSIRSSNGSPEAWHFLSASSFAFGFVFARFLLDKFIFRKIAIWLSSNTATSLKLDEATHVKIVKCSESMWKLAYYATVEMWVLKTIYHEPWFRDTKQYFRGWPDQELKLPLRLYYMCQCGFYIYSIGALVAWETRRKDFSVMMSHHVITVILIGYSYITRNIKGVVPPSSDLGFHLSYIFPFACILSLFAWYTNSNFGYQFETIFQKVTSMTGWRFFRIGAIILALHDGSDIFMEAAKVFKYSEREVGASVCFGLFAVSWLLLRLVFFPFWVIRSSSGDLVEYLDLSTSYDTLVYYVFNTMLLMLLVFHIYWWFLICAMIHRQLKNRGKVGEDIRSDSEDDD